MTELTAASAFTGAESFEGEPIEGLPPALARPARTRYDNFVDVRGLIDARLRRNIFFNCRLFSDPAWDMLLELYAATLTHRRLTVSRLSERSRTAMTTSLRWIAALEKEGLIKREQHPTDGRVVFIALTHRAIVAMDTYFADLPVEGAPS